MSEEKSITNNYEHQISELPMIEVEETGVDGAGQIIKGKKICIKGYTLEEVLEVYGKIKRK